VTSKKKKKEMNKSPFSFYDIVFSIQPYKTFLLARRGWGVNESIYTEYLEIIAKYFMGR